MKKSLAVLAAVLLLLAAFPAATVGALVPPRTYRHFVRDIPRSPTIDGRADPKEWGVPLFTFLGSKPKESKGKLWQTDRENPLVPEEINGYFSWDKANLYIAVTVTDPVHSNRVKDKPDLHKGDLLMLRIQSPADGQEYIWGFAFSSFGPKNRLAYQWSPQPKDLPNGKKNGYFYANTSGGGRSVTTYELAIPADMLGLARFTTGDVLPISVALHLTDDTDPEQTVTPSGAYYEWGVGLLNPSETDERCELHLTDGTKTEGDFRYRFSDNGVTLMEYLGRDREVTIPDQFEGQPVTAIGVRAFEGCSQVADIRWPETVRQIGREAFLGTAFEQKLAAMPNGPVYAGRMLCRVNGPVTGAPLVVREGTVGIADSVFRKLYDTRPTVLVPESLVSFGTDNDAHWIFSDDTPLAAYAAEHGLPHTITTRLDSENGDIAVWIQPGGEQISGVTVERIPDEQRTLQQTAVFGTKATLLRILPENDSGETAPDCSGYIQFIPQSPDNSLFVFRPTARGGFEQLRTIRQEDSIAWTAPQFGEFILVSHLPENPGRPLGDIDGNNTVNTTDARLALQFAVDKISLFKESQAFGDVNGDGKVDTTDARLILQYAIGKIPRF